MLAELDCLGAIVDAAYSGVEWPDERFKRIMPKGSLAKLPLLLVILSVLSASKYPNAESRPNQKT